MKKYWQKLLPWTKPYMKWLVLTFMLSIPLSLIKGYQTYLLKDLFDQGFGTNAPFSDALKLAITLVVLQVINYPFRFFHFYWIKVISEKIASDIRATLYDKLMKVPLSFYQKQKQGEILSLLQNDVSIISDSIRFFPGIIREPITAVGLLGVALYHDWRLTLILFLVIPFFILIFNVTGKSIRRKVSLVQQKIAHVTHLLAEGMAGHKIIKAYNLQEYSLKRLKASQNDFIDSYSKAASIEEQSNPLVEIVASLAIGAIILYAHHRITSGQLTTGGFISFMAAMAFFLEPIRKFTDSNIKIERGRGALDRLDPLLASAEEPNFGKKIIQREDFSKGLSIENLSFQYDAQSEFVVKNFSLNIAKGKKIGIVGLSGSGKSTLINLLLRFYRAQNGHIKIDGIPIEKFDLKSYREMFALVSQDIFLFNDTLEENLKTGNDYSSSEIHNALEISNSSLFVEKLSEKNKTLLGDRGLRLSGGQAQRITMARAVLKNASILLFDEATSALDNESEKLVQAGLERMAGEKTVIAIAHRLSSLQNYDQIVVMKHGEIIEMGTHQELLIKGGEYKKLYELGLS